MANTRRDQKYRDQSKERAISFAPRVPLRAFAVGVLTISATAFSFAADDSSRQLPAVVCVSDAAGAWNAKARGTLTRTKSEQALIYELKAREQSFTWRFVTNAQGGTTVVGPGYLLDRFGAEPPPSDPADRRQTLYASGEIREEAPTSALRLVIGSKCPASRR